MMMTKTNNTNEVSLNKINIDDISNLNNKNISSIDNYPYLKIDSTNFFKKISPNELKAINEKINKFYKKKLNLNENTKNEYITNILRNILEKLFPKTDMDINKIISLISSQIKSKKKLNRDVMEEYINYFYDLRDRYKFSNKIELNKTLFKNIGIVLCYVHSKLKDYSIDSNGIKEYINTILTQKINVLTDYFLYCNKSGSDPMLLKKTNEWKKLVKIKNYKIPPELIFLINIFQSCIKLEINIEFDEDILEQEDLQLFTMVLLNLEYVFPNLEIITINLVHNKIQQILNQRHDNRILNLVNFEEETLKKNYTKDDIILYDVKWDFDQEFNLSYFNEIKRISKRNKRKISLEDYCIISNNEEKDKELLLKNNAIFSENNIFSLDFFTNDKTNKIDDTGFIDLELDEGDKDLTSCKTNSSSDATKVKNKENTKETKEDKKMKYIELLEKNSIFFDFILMAFVGISLTKSLRKLNILSNDYYVKDLINYIKVFYELDMQKFFHIFDILYNKPNGFDLLNIELNSLDIFSFNKMIEAIYMNLTLTSINISFFSADVCYSIANLYKIYTEQIKTQKYINEYLFLKGKNFDIGEFEKKMLEDISKFFIDNLSIFFEIIKNKTDLKELGLNFDFPDILINNNIYKTVIIKFILNIIMLVDNNEAKNISNLKKLTLLSPKLIFDKKLETNIDNFFKKISLYNNSKTLMNLNIQFQFYQINYIKNLISTNLFSLNIGDLDIFTFDKLVNYLTSYNFSIQSNLSYITIKLIGAITNFNTQIKLIFQKLFNINLRNLIKLNLFTNLIINKKMNYLFLNKLLQNNWISNYVITLNEQSKKIINYYNIFGRKKILFLVSESIQNIVFKESGNFIVRRNKFHSSEIYWILKILFINKQRNNYTYLGYFEIQYLIFTILKYLFLTANAKLEHEYNFESNKS